MVVSFATSQEWFYAGTGITQTVDAYTVPSLESIDLAREELYYDLIDWAGTTTDNSTKKLRRLELRVAKRWIRGIREGKHIECKLTNDEANEIAIAFNNLGGGPIQPGKDS